MKLATLFRAHYRSNPPGKSSGQSIVELALMLPVLIILIAGIVDLGRIYFAYITVINAAREGARYAAAHPPRGAVFGMKVACDYENTADIRSRTQVEATASGKINPDQLTVAVSCDSSDVEQWIKVTVRYDFRLILTRMVLVGNPIPIQSDATMEIFGQ